MTNEGLEDFPFSVESGNDFVHICGSKIWMLKDFLNKTLELICFIVANGDYFSVSCTKLAGDRILMTQGGTHKRAVIVDKSALLEQIETYELNINK